jgi:hypothetical protein
MFLTNDRIARFLPGWAGPTKHVFLLLACVVAVLPSFGLAAEPQSPVKAGQKGSAELLDQILHWLPSDTETILVVTNPNAADNWAKEKTDAKSSSGFEKSRTPFRSKSQFDGKILLDVEGSRCFRAPTNLGEMPYEGCQVTIYDKSAESALTAAMESAMKQAKRTTTLAGKQVAIFEEKSEGDLWTFYLAHPKPQVILCATHEGYLKELLIQIGKPPAKRAMPPDLAEWKYVDTTAPVWAIRHFSKVNPGKDPSSPLRPDTAAANVPDLEAIGLTFSANPRAMRATVCYLTHANEAIVIARKVLASDETKPKIEEVEPGVVRTTISTKDADFWGAFLYVLMARLGRGVWV